MHRPILDLVRRRLDWKAPVERALDVGCGAGLSTAPLAAMARRCTGVEPFPAMLRFASTIAPEADFAAGRAEALPIRSGSIDLCTAAGSLPFTEVSDALAELRRVLRPNGVLVIYDFRQGSDFRDNDRLSVWHAEFKRRYPPPKSADFDVESLPYAMHGMELAGYQPFEIGIPLTPGFYLNYAMTETNVAAAIGRGTSESEIRRWCLESLNSVFLGEPREVLFKGYIAYAR